MDPILLAFLIIVLFATPKLWTRYIFYKYSRDRDDIPGTGGQLVEHLLNRLSLKRVQLQPSRSRSHYDPRIKAVRLSEHTMNTNSLTAVVRGAFEVGHALQDSRNEHLLDYRYQLLQLAAAGERFGIVGVLLSPIIMAFSAMLGGVLFFAAVVSLFSGIATQLLVIPIEWEAGFSIALPLLTEGAYVAPQDWAAVRLLFLACALNRLAHALADVIDGRHWLRVIGLWRPSRF